jgi:hypothetical protein
MDAGALGVQFALTFGMTEGTQLLANTPILHSLQHLLDPADAAVFAPHILARPMTVGGKTNAPKDLLNLYVKDDESVPNEGNEVLVRAMMIPIAKNHLPLALGLPIPEVDVPGGTFAPTSGTFGLAVEESPSTHADNLYAQVSLRGWGIPLRDLSSASLLTQYHALTTKFTIKTPNYATNKMVVSFLKSALAGSTKVTDVPTPVADYDGDGTPDSADAFPNDPTRK